MSQPHVNVYVNQPGAETGAATKSYFDGSLAQYVGWVIIGGLITVFTLGLCAPWAICKLYGWKINHTVVEVRRLRFDGTGMELFGSWIKWLLLCIITVGIYAFFVGIALNKWKASHTFFAS